MKIKICGLTSEAVLATAVAAGADFLGLVLAPSTRRVTPVAARLLAKSARTLKNQQKIVGVFANAPAAEVNRLADYCSLDYVQLSGNESLDYCCEINRPLIKAIHVSCQSLVNAVLDEIEAIMALHLPGSIVLLDKGSVQANGGTGQVFDWQIARKVVFRYPVMIAGGLNIVNVGVLIRQVQPWGVDISSGVETDGKKDEEKIRAFIEKVKSAEKIENHMDSSILR
jgi:phosphoribosylanthranilate isomerase